MWPHLKVQSLVASMQMSHSSLDGPTATIVRLEVATPVAAEGICKLGKAICKVLIEAPGAKWSDFDCYSDIQHLPPSTRH